MRVLLVEDNAMNAQLFEDALATEGHDVAIESDGPSGRARALSEPFDLIVLDVHLPGLTGDRVCRDLKAAGVAAPIVALSSSAMPEQVRIGLAAGFDAYLTKPISPSELRAAVRRLAPNGNGR